MGALPLAMNNTRPPSRFLTYHTPASQLQVSGFVPHAGSRTSPNAELTFRKTKAS